MASDRESGRARERESSEHQPHFISHTCPKSNSATSNSSVSAVEGDEGGPGIRPWVTSTDWAAPAAKDSDRHFCCHCCCCCQSSEAGGGRTPAAPLSNNTEVAPEGEDGAVRRPLLMASRLPGCLMDCGIGMGLVCWGGGGCGRSPCKRWGLEGSSHLDFSPPTSMKGWAGRGWVPGGREGPGHMGRSPKHVRGKLQRKGWRGGWL